MNSTNADINSTFSADSVEFVSSRTNTLSIYNFTSALYATSTNVAEGFEESMIPIFLQGSDKSVSQREVFYRIESLPRHGIIFEYNENDPISVGDLLDQTGLYPYKTRAEIKYKGQLNFFTMPYLNVTYNDDDDPNLHDESTYVDESFQYTILSQPPEAEEKKTSGLFESSPIIRQQINVVNVNDPLAINIPYGEHSLTAFSSLSWNTEGCYKEPDRFWRNNFTENCETRLRLDGFQVLDADRNLDYVRVDVESSSGILTLNQEYLIQTSFAICSNRTVSGVEDVTWNCDGTGTGDSKVSTIVSLRKSEVPHETHVYQNIHGAEKLTRPLLYSSPPPKMTFISRPLHLNNILNNMTFESLKEGEDKIVISIFDGKGGECLSSMEHEILYIIKGYKGQPSLHKGCKITSRSIPVNVLNYSNGKSTRGTKKIPMQLGVASIFGSAVFFLLIALKIRSLRARKDMYMKSKRDNGSNRLSIFRRGNLTKKTSEKLSTPSNIQEKGKKNRKDRGSRFSISRRQRKQGIVDKNNEGYMSDSSQAYMSDSSQAYMSDSSNVVSGGASAVGYDWIRYVDEASGDYYYAHVDTGEIIWTEPDENYAVDGQWT